MKIENNIEIDRDIIISTIKLMSKDQLINFIDSAKLDFRIWHRVKIDCELMPWWACECEISDIKKRYTNVEFEPIPLQETLIQRI